MDSFVVWWNNLSLEVRLVARDGAILLAGLVVGWILGGALKRFLVKHGVDPYLRVPWAQPEPASAAKGRPGPQKAAGAVPASLPSVLMGWCLTVTIWAGAVVWVASLHEWRSTVQTIQSLLIGGWEAVGVLFLALLACGWLGRMVYDLLHAPWLQAELDALLGGTAASAPGFSETAARGACLTIYVFVFLLVPVVGGGLFRLPLLAVLVTPAWQIYARLVMALAALAIGYLALAWARSLSLAAHKEGQDHATLDYYVRLGIMLVTTRLALRSLVAVSTAASVVSTVFFLAFVAVLLLVPVWPYRGDVWAGIMLRLHRVKTATVDGVPFEVTAIGPLWTTLSHLGQTQTRRNSLVLDEALKAAGERPEAV